MHHRKNIEHLKMLVKEIVKIPYLASQCPQDFILLRGYFSKRVTAGEEMYQSWEKQRKWNEM